MILFVSLLYIDTIKPKHYQNMKYIYPIILAILLSLMSCNDQFKDVSMQLEKELSGRDDSFTRRLDTVKKEEAKLIYATDKIERFNIYYGLFDLTRSFEYALSYKYATEALNVANEIGDPNLIAKAKAGLISTFTSGGLFPKAADVIRSLNLKGVNDETKREVFYNIVRYYSDQIDYMNVTKSNSRYLDSLRLYTESIINLSPNKDYYYTYAKAYYDMSYGNAREALADLTDYYESSNNSAHHNSILTFLIAQNQFEIGDYEKGSDFLIKSVGYDIEAAARENRSIMKMSEFLFEEGEKRMSERLIGIAIDDAKLYNARHRNMEVNEILSIINQSKITSINKRKNILYVLLSIVTLLTLTAIGFILKIRSDSRIIKKSKNIIQAQLDRLSEINNKLIESNEIKEYYIIDSLYKKNESLKQTSALLKKIDTKVKNKLYNDLRYIYKEFNVKKERELFFNDFDNTFLKLFPNFISEYNSLFKEEDQIKITEGGDMPPEVRIFALMRLGITDNDKISNFLDLSINTIYTYKTKVKSKSVVPKDEFESRILNINLHPSDHKEG